MIQVESTESSSLGTGTGNLKRERSISKYARAQGSVGSCEVDGGRTHSATADGDLDTVLSSFRHQKIIMLTALNEVLKYNTYYRK